MFLSVLRPHVQLPAPVRQVAELFPRLPPADRLLLSLQFRDALGDAVLGLVVRKCRAWLIPCGIQAHSESAVLHGKRGYARSPETYCRNIVFCPVTADISPVATIIT